MNYAVHVGIDIPFLKSLTANFRKATELQFKRLSVLSWVILKLSDVNCKQYLFIKQRTDTI